MKKMRFLIVLIVILILSLSGTALASGSTPRLVDQADLIEAVEETYILNRLNEISDHYDLDVVIVTTACLDGFSAQAYADDYYDYNSYRPDGILLLISMEEREWAISTTGYGITAFTDAGLAYMEEQFIDDLSDENYSDAFVSFSEVCEEMIIQAQSGSPYDAGNLPKVPFQLVKSLLICLAIGFVTALIATGIMAAQLKSVRPKGSAADYVKSGSMQLTQAMDLYLYRHVDRQRRQTNNSSGGSTVHRSSSGRSHGGRSGKF